MKTIKKGQEYLCFKDYLMDNGKLAYKEGDVYKATDLNELPSIIFDDHIMTIDADFECHFKRVKNKPDSIVESVVKKFKDRSNVGIKKYGTTLDRKDINFDGWAEHLQQELMDGVLYLERLKKEFNK